jgi:hypothetical protein
MATEKKDRPWDGTVKTCLMIIIENVGNEIFKKDHEQV